MSKEKNKELYEFAKKYCDEYEKNQNKIYIEQDFDYLSSRNLKIAKAGLQAFIVSDFVSLLSEKLQYEIRKECMNQMYGD